MILVVEVGCEDGLRKHAKLQITNNVLAAAAATHIFSHLFLVVFIVGEYFQYMADFIIFGHFSMLYATTTEDSHLMSIIYLNI